MKKSIILFSFMNFIFYSLKAQQLITTRNSYIITLNTVYRTNLIDMNSNYYHDIYMLYGDTYQNADSLFRSLTQIEYSSSTAILDTLSKFFQVRKIIREDPYLKESTDVDTVLLNYNNYRRGYLFQLRKDLLGSDTGSLMQLLTLKREITFVREPCKFNDWRCFVTIRRFKNCH